MRRPGAGKPMPDASREPGRRIKERVADPSLDSERESDATHGRRAERDAKRREDPRDHGGKPD